MSDAISQAMAAADAGKEDAARQMLMDLLRADTDNLKAWGRLYQLCRTDAERLTCLEHILRLQPDDVWAQRKLAEIGPQEYQSGKVESTPTSTSTAPLTGGTIQELYKTGALSQKAAAFLKAAVIARTNVVASAVEHPDAQVLLGALKAAVPEGVSTVRAEPVISSQNVQELLAAMLADLGVAMGAIEASGARNALDRLAMLAYQADPDDGEIRARETVAGGVEIVAHVGVLPDGRAAVTQIAEVDGLQDESILLSDVFTTNDDLQLKPTGTLPRILGRIHATGIDLPVVVFQP